MEIRLQPIDVGDYDSEKPMMASLARKIWTRPESLSNVTHSIDRWGTSKNESGTYLYILKQDLPIGITGFYIIKPEDGVFGLRHHGTTVKGTGRPSLDKLVEYIKSEHPEFKNLIELIPEGREDLITTFESWGFHLVDSQMEWEPKKDYYKYAMSRES